MEKSNLSFIEKCDAVVLFSLVGTGLIIFAMNRFADLFLKLGIRQLWGQRALVVAPFMVAAILLVVYKRRR